MKIEIETSSYNEKRYGKPYIALIDPNTGSVSRWGTWIGEAGEEGFLEIDIPVGSIVMHGQKDYRNAYKGKPLYGILEEDGKIVYYTKSKAIKTARELSK
jgi:hypothetical protein